MPIDGLCEIKTRENDGTAELTLEQADKLVDWTLARALEIGLRPITCCVTNTNAALKVFKAQEETPMMRYELCYGKAYAALALGRSTSLIRERAEDRPLFNAYLTQMSHGKMFAEKGGMLIRDDIGTPEKYLDPGYCAAVQMRG